MRRRRSPKYMHESPEELFAAQTPQPGRLDADPLDRAHEVARLDEVADLERPVEDDGNRTEDVAEDALKRESDGDPADAQAGQKRRDLDPHHAQGDDRHAGPE